MPEHETIRRLYANRLAAVTDELFATQAALRQAQDDLAQARAELHNATTATEPVPDGGQ